MSGRRNHLNETVAHNYGLAHNLNGDIWARPYGAHNPMLPVMGFSILAP